MSTKLKETASGLRMYLQAMLIENILKAARHFEDRERLIEVLISKDYSRLNLLSRENQIKLELLNELLQEEDSEISKLLL